MTGQDQDRRHRLRRTIVLFVVLLLIVAAALILQGRAAAKESPSETIRFNHQKHLAAAVPCLFCHPGALNGQVATIPSVAKCAGCHRNIQVTGEKGRAAVEVLLRAVEEGRPLRWPKIVDLPDFVYFNHRPHIAAGKNCEQCHGDVSQMTQARPAFRINMGFCLQNCHRHQDATKRERLMDCATCHQ